ncbi:LysM peptidoglycan-binding domain-containing protein [Aeromonas simiae]|uniref:LysM peptidoglycan-binding domain-containing protein n=1 Tax=Aeromonas simiae TaxID=218936 RepID=UPI0005A6B1BC|nr:LysM domain-containing protein [Aeromonas simiae]
MNLTRTALICLLLGGSQGIWADTLALKQGYPETYMVRSGDTLWDIAGHYLQKPWQWPTLWQGNPQIANPHLIYPGDRLQLSWVDGQPRLMSAASGSKRVITLSPRVRSENKLSPIPTLSLDAIGPFLQGDYVFSHAGEVRGLPFVLGNNDKQIAVLEQHTIYVQGLLEPGRQYGTYRPGRAYKDAKSGEWLGQEAVLTGIVQAETLWNNGQTQAKLLANRREVRQGDVLLPLPDDVQAQAHFTPHAGALFQAGSVIAIPNQASAAGKLEVVLIDKGGQDGLDAGSVLDIRRPGVAYVTGDTAHHDYRDTASSFDRAFHSGINQRLPSEAVAKVMLFKVYHRLSYGLIVQSQDMVRVGYSVGAL